MDARFEVIFGVYGESSVLPMLLTILKRVELP